MKNKIFKIMGVALALVLALSLGAAFMPASNPTGPEAATAGDLTWSKLAPPSTTSNVLVKNAEDLGPVAISPNFAEDSTVFAVVNESGANPLVYKSTNGGHTWVATTTTDMGSASDIGVALVLSPNYAEDSTVFVATQDPDAGGSGTGVVYRSTNGGSSFGQLGSVTLTAGESITSMDVSPDYNGVGVIAIGIADRCKIGAAAAAHCLQVWGSNDVLNWTAITADAAYDISAVKFSPNYVVDSTILTVASAANDEPYLYPVVGSVWSSSLKTAVGATAVKDVAWNAAETTYLNYASIAVPSDYNSTVSTLRRVYVSIVADVAVDDNDSNVYRITGTTSGSEIATAMGEKLYPIDYSGTFAEGTLVGALYKDGAAAADVYRTTNPTSSVVNWYEVSGAANKPTGTTSAHSTNSTAPAISGWVQMSATYADDSTVIVGTQGDDSAFGISTDGAVSFNETGLIENNEENLTSLPDVALSPDYDTDSTMFLISDADTASAVNTNVWVTYNGGSTWFRCFTETWGPDGVIACSNEFDTDSVVYVGDQEGTDVYYSANAGRSWSGRAVAAGRITGMQTMAAPDATTLYVGDYDSGKVAKSTNSGWTWPGSMTKSTAATKVMSLKVDGSTVLVGGGGGTVRRSDDGGSTWSKVSGSLPGGGDVYVTFNDTFVWAVQEVDGAVYRSEDGGAWANVGAASRGDDAIEIILTSDGSMYIAEKDGAASDADIFRTIGPETPYPKPDVAFQDMANPTTAQISAMDAISGSGNIIAYVETTPSLRVYTDTLAVGTAGPELVSPADGTIWTRARSEVKFQVEPMDRVTEYEVRYGTDPNFDTFTPKTIGAPDIRTEAVTIAEGAVTYWKARASEPLYSPWSEVWSLETMLETAPYAPTPRVPGTQSGSTIDVLIEPVFNWSALKYADGYQPQLATDADMTDLIADETLGNVTSWKCTTTLAYSTTYYWRVRALRGGTVTSDWSEVVGFTTMAKPVAPAPPVIIEPTPPAPPAPAPITPAYIYAIIAIGAVLVIVVIVLIVRTRRVP